MSTREDVAAAIRLLSAGGYRTPEITEDVLRLWTEQLAPFRARSIGVAAREWAGNVDRFPSLSQFKAAARSTEQRLERGDRPAIGTAAEHPLPPGDQRRRVADIKRQIAEAEGPLFKGKASGVIR